VADDGFRHRPINGMEASRTSDRSRLGTGNRLCTE